jgi:hypothetical protein
MSLRRAINAHCRACIYDPLDYGTCAQQIACCTVFTCELYPERPVTAVKIPLELLNRYGLCPGDLDARARALVEFGEISSVEGQIGLPLASDEALRSAVEN